MCNIQNMCQSTVDVINTTAVNRRLLIVKFGGAERATWIFNSAGALEAFKGPLHSWGLTQSRARREGASWMLCAGSSSGGAGALGLRPREIKNSRLGPSGERRPLL